MAYITFQPSDYFNTKLYTGNGSTNAITGVGFQPDMLWVKSRSRADNHRLMDSLRTTYSLIPNATDFQRDVSGDGFTSLDSDGFTLNGSGGGGEFNASSATFASWNWKANGSGSSNTDGTISSTVSANTTSGFSIVKYVGNATVGATVGHGLSATPKIVFFKNLDTATGWNVIAPSILGNGYYLVLNSDASSTFYNSSWTTNSTQIVLAGGTGHNASGDNFIAYCFAEKKGYSKIGSYTGNGEASDNAFIYTGFKPAFVLIKATDVDEWRIYDNKRANPFNVIDVRLKANSSDAESSGNNECDFLSNGIKIRSNSGGVGSSGQEYIYMCFAEAPIVSSNDIPATAR